MPSSDYGSLDDTSVLPLGGMNKLHSDDMEFAGVYDRYIVQRSSTGKCCKKKSTCINLLGEIKSKCGCKTCSPQVPSADGKSCQDECPEGTSPKITTY